MKKNLLPKITTALICSAVLVFSSCKNETEIVDLKNIPTAEAFQKLRQSALDDITITKTFKGEEGLLFTTNKGAEIDIAPCLQKQNGDYVTGDVQLSFIEIYDRGTMVLTNKPVMGKNSNGDLLPLITGGQYNIKATQGNEELISNGCPVRVKIPTANTGGVDRKMLLWKGIINQEENLVWELNEVSDKEPGEPGRESNLVQDDEGIFYYVLGNEFGWVNVDRFYNDSRKKTKIKVAIPEGYTNKNSAVYLTFEGEENLLAQLDIYNTSGKHFTEHFGFVPVDINVNVIFVSENNGSVSYVIKKVKITANSTINIIDTEIKTTTKAQLITLINKLN